MRESEQHPVIPKEVRDVDSNNALSVEQAAQRMGVAPVTVRSWLRQGRIAYHRLGRRIVFEPKDLDRFLADHRVEARQSSR